MESMFLGIVFLRAIDEVNEKISMLREMLSRRRGKCVQQYLVSRRTLRKTKIRYGFHNATMFARGSDG